MTRADVAQAEVAALLRRLDGKDVRLAALDQELAGYRNVLRTLHLDLAELFRGGE